MKRTGEDFTGRTIGRLYVENRNCVMWAIHWNCRCACGEYRIKETGDLRKKTTISCGCYMRENAKKQMTTHGMCGTPEYMAHVAMIDRCYRKKNASYKWYGALGIGVCDKWRNSFEAFYADVGDRPSPKHSIDRIDGTLDYFPKNVKWSTQKEQARNKKNNRLHTIDGKTFCMSQWCEEFNIDEGTVYSRINRQGMSVSEALTKPVVDKRITYNSKTQSISKWSRECGVQGSTIRYRLRCGWSVERALSTEVRKF